MSSRAVAFVVAVLVGLAGCITPSIPIPPPEPSNMSFAIDVEAGAATFRYGPEPNFSDAIVYVYNRTQRQGLITAARADGSVGPTQPFPAAAGDNVAVTFETPDTVVSTCVVVREGVPSIGEYCTQ